MTSYNSVIRVYTLTHLQGCSFGYFVGGWGKPPVDEMGRPLYGDVFGMWQEDQPGGIQVEAVDRTLWGELESDEEEEEIVSALSQFVVSMYMSTYLHTSVNLPTYIYLPICICIPVHIYLSLYMYVCTYISCVQIVCVCLYVHVHVSHRWLHSIN